MSRFHRFNSRLLIALLLFSLLTLCVGIRPVRALQTLGFIRYAYGLEGQHSCGEGTLLVGAQLTGSVQDPASSASYHGPVLPRGDFYAIAAFDGNGHYLWDSGTLVAPVGNTISPTNSIPLRGITARPVTVVLMDLAQAMNSPLSRDTGPTRWSFSIDPTQFAGNCASLPQTSFLLSSYTLLRVAHTTCTPGEAPTFDYMLTVAASDHVVYSGFLTNLRTSARSGPFNRPLLDGPHGPFIGTAAFGTVVVPPGTRPNDTLVMEVDTISSTNPHSPQRSTLSFNCTARRGSLADDNILNPVDSGANAGNAPVCFVSVSVVVPPSGKTPGYNKTQQQPTDCRLNNDAGANVAVYCVNGGVMLYAVDHSQGYFALSLTKASLAQFPADPKANILIAQALGARLYRLTDGSLQVNRSTAEAGKDYVFHWAGC